MGRIVVKHLIPHACVLPMLHGRQDTGRPFRAFVDGGIARQCLKGPREKRAAQVTLRLFFPRLHPMLPGGTRDTHTVVAPEVPTGGSGGQAIFRPHPHGHIDHPVGVMSARRGSITASNVAVLFASVTGVRCVCHQEINRVTGAQIAQVMQRALSGCMA